MKIVFTESFQRDLKNLEDRYKAQLLDVLLKIPKVLGETHLHGGAGIRKLHHSGIYEARMGLGLRMIFTFSDNILMFDRLGNHDEIKRYLKNI